MLKKFLLLIFCVFFTKISTAQVQKIEPPFWWSDMHNPELQLLVYGKNIQDLQPDFSGEIPIVKITKVANPNYLFVTINTRGIAPGSYKLRFKKKGETVKTMRYELKERAPQSAQRKGFSSADVIYLLMPDRFANGNTHNDSVKGMPDKANRQDPNGRHGGDIAGIIDHLDYLKELGVTTIWSTPLLEDNEPKTSYHGYAQSDYYRIDPRFGSNKDYKKLADELHQRDMKLIMDYVTNHWGAQSWIIKDLPSQDWIHYWKDGKNGFKRSSYRMSTQFDPYVAQIDAKTCMDGWFDTSMPDMNQANPLVLNYMVQNAVWWIEYAGLDGFRVDTYPYNDKEAIAQWTQRIMEEYPNFNIVGEVWMHDQAQIAYWQKDSKVGAIQGYNSHLPSVMDFTLTDAINQAFHEPKQGWNTGMMRVYHNFINDFLYPNPENLLVFLENHDTNRFNQLYPEFENYQLALTLILTTRGIPELYYGSEIGMKGDKSKGDGNIRRDFPGGWPTDTQNAFTAEGRTARQNKYFNFTKKLLNWRKNTELIHHGKLLQYLPQNNVYVFFRYNAQKSVIVILNNNPQPQTLDLTHFKEGLKNYTKGKDVITGKMYNLQKNLRVKGKTAIVLELTQKNLP